MKDDTHDTLAQIMDTTGMESATTEEQLEAAIKRREAALAGKKRLGEFTVVFTDEREQGGQMGAIIWGDMPPDTPLIVRIMIHTLARGASELVKVLSAPPVDRSKMN